MARIILLIIDFIWLLLLTIPVLTRDIEHRSRGLAFSLWLIMLANSMAVFMYGK